MVHLLAPSTRCQERVKTQAKLQTAQWWAKSWWIEHWLPRPYSARRYLWAFSKEKSAKMVRRFVDEYSSDNDGAIGAEAMHDKSFARA